MSYKQIRRCSLNDDGSEEVTHLPAEDTLDAPTSTWKKENTPLVEIGLPARPIYRYTVLFVACLFSIGTYFTSSAVGVVQTQIQSDFGVSDTLFEWQYTLSSIPNIFVPFFGGFMLDKLGLLYGTLVTCFVVFLGGLVMALSPYTHNFYTLIMGRIIFAMGSEVSYVAQNTICCLWFKDKGMALAMGLTVSAGRLGSFLAFSVTAWVAKLFNDYRAALWLGAIMAGLSLVAAICYFILHRYAIAVGHKFDENADPNAMNRISIRDVLKFPFAFWLIVILSMTFFNTIWPYEATGVAYLENRYNLDQTRAGFLLSIIPFISLIFSPPFGLVVDRVGYRAIMATVALFLLLIGFTCLLTTSMPLLYLSIGIMGVVSTAVPVAVWPAIPMIISSENLGTAFGSISVANNMASAIVYWGKGRVSNSIVFLLIVSLISFVASIVWNIVDTVTGGVVNKTKKKST